MSFRFRLILFALAYWAGAELSYLLLHKTGDFVAFWPPVGLYLAMLLATPRRRWWAVMLAAGVPNFLADAVVHQQTLLVSLGLLLVNLSTPLLGATLIVRRCRPAFSLARLPHVLWWSAVVSLVSTPLGALGGAAVITRAYSGVFGQKMLFWWLGDLLGVLLVTPLAYGVLVERAWPRRAQIIEAVGLLLSLSAATGLIFRLPHHLALPPAVLFFFLLWAALRFGATTVAAAVTVLAVIAIWLTATGFGPFSFQEMPSASLLMAQLLVITGALLFYILAAVVAERHAAEDKLRNINVDLKQQVQARTAKLTTANQQLRASEARLRLGTDVAGFALSEIDYTSETHRLSPEAAALFGLGDTALTVPRTTVHATFHPNDRAELATHLDKCLDPEGNGWLACEHRIVRPDGAVRWLNVSKQVFFDETQHPPRPTIGVLAAQDITARKQAEAALRAAEERLRLATEAAQMFAWEIDETTHAIQWSDNAAKIIGCAPEQLPAAIDNGAFFVYPADRARLLQEYEQVVRDGSSRYVAEFRGLDENRYWQTHGLLIRDDAGQLLKVLGVTQNITERKQQERNQQLLLKLGELMRATHDAEQLLAQAADLLGAHLQATHCLFNEIDRRSELATVRHEYRQPDAKSFLGTVALAKYSPVTGAALEAGQTVIVNAAQSDARTAAHYATGYAPDGIGAYLVVPLQRGRHWVAALWVDHGAPHVWQEWESELIKTVAERAWLAAEKLRSEQAVRESETRLRLATGAAGMFAWELDLVTQTVKWGENAALILDLPVNLLPQSIEQLTQLIHPEDLARDTQAFQQAIADGSNSYATETRMLNPVTGYTLWTASHGLLVRDAQGRVVRAFGMTQDIGERKAAEAQLRQSETRFHNIFETTPVSIWEEDFTAVRQALDELKAQGVTDLREYFQAHPAFVAAVAQQVKVLDVNAESVRMFGARDKAELLDALDKTFTPASFAMFAEELAVMATGGHSFEAEVTMQTLQGERLETLLSANFVAPAEAHPRALVTFSNITERKQAEAAREQLLAREQQARQLAEDANRAKDDWLAMVTHELRSPLNAILGHARLLEMRRAELPTDFAAFADVVRRNGERQNELINDLLDTARITTGKLRLEFAPLECAPLIEDALAVVQLSAQAKNLSLRTDLAPNVGVLTGDAMRLQQVVLNLLTNAVKFTPAGGVIEISLRRAAQQVVLTVNDTGSGITPDFLPHIFERFSQADTSKARRYGGLGLGLALVKQIVEMHGGTITAASAGAQQGATFTVTLPVRSAESGVRKTAATPHHSLPPIPHSNAEQRSDHPSHSALWQGVRVLVVDDDSETLAWLSALFIAQGAEIRTAADATTAWAALTDGAHFNLLLCDIALPGEDGFSLLRRWRAQERDVAAPPLPAIALLAQRQLPARMQALMAGFQMHIAKPLEADELLAVAQSLLDRARLIGSSQP